MHYRFRAGDRPPTNSFGAELAESVLVFYWRMRKKHLSPPFYRNEVWQWFSVVWQFLRMTELMWRSAAAGSVAAHQHHFYYLSGFNKPSLKQFFFICV